MKQILAFTRKEIQQWVQRPGSWIVVFVVPLIFIWIMQAVFGSGTPVVTVFAVNEDKSAEATRVLEALKSADTMRVIELKTRDEADQRVGAGELMAAVIIPDGFGQAIGTPGGAQIEVITDPARSEQANIVTGLAGSALAPIIVDAEVSRGVETSIDQVMKGISTSPATGGQSGGQATNGQAKNQEGLKRFFSAALKGIVSSSVEEALNDPLVSVDARPFDQQETEQSAATGTPAATKAAATPNANASAGAAGAAGTAGAAGAASRAMPPGNNPAGTAVDAAGAAASTTTTVTKTNVKAARQPSLLDALVPGYSLMFVFFLVSNLAGTVIEERQTGTLNRLLIAPVARSQILLGKMLPYFLIAVAQFITVLLVSKLLFGIDLGNSTLALVMMIFASSLAMVTLGILVAAFAQSEAQASGLATVLVLILAVVGGSMFPTISIPGLKMITPHYWAMQGFLSVIARGLGPEGVLQPAGVLVTMSAVFFTIGTIRFRFE